MTVSDRGEKPMVGFQFCVSEVLKRTKGKSDDALLARGGFMQWRGSEEGEGARASPVY